MDNLKGLIKTLTKALVLIHFVGVGVLSLVDQATSHNSFSDSFIKANIMMSETYFGKSEDRKKELSVTMERMHDRTISNVADQLVENFDVDEILAYNNVSTNVINKSHISGVRKASRTSKLNYTMS